MAAIRGWYDEHDAALKKLLAIGLANGDVAAVLTRRFGRVVSGAAVEHRARRLGLHSLARGGRPTGKRSYR
jgi:hypothetical protein